MRCSKLELLDNLVGAHEDRFRDRNPKDSRGPKVHDHIESGWALDREIGRLGAVQDPSNITGSTAKHIGKVRPIGDETSGIHMRPVKVYCGKGRFRSKICDSCSVSQSERVRQNDESVGIPALCVVERTLQVGGALQFDG
jgi:hypothetical protein